MSSLDHVRRCVAHFRKIGLVPLPSRTDRKGPAMKNYGCYWDQDVPESVFSEWTYTNVQLITGAKSTGSTKIIVVDCDGPEAASVWKRMCAKTGHDPREGWVSKTGSGSGWHTYYRLPGGVGECPSRRLWGIYDTFGENGKGDWQKHKEVRLLGDRSLVIAPPSVHVDSGKPYRFIPGFGPADKRLPGIAPKWLIESPSVLPPRSVAEELKSAHVIKRSIRPSDALMNRDAVLDAIPERIALVKSWGLSCVSLEPNEAGWHSCKAIGREDKTPSGRISINGCYEDRREPGVYHSLFDVGVLLGQFQDWKECLAWCVSEFVRKNERNEKSENLVA